MTLPTPETYDREAILAWARAYMRDCPPDFELTHAGQTAPYLQRWYIVPKNPVGGVYLHRFMASDDDRALHDHPTDNTSWVLDGYFVEHLVDGSVTRFTGDIIKRTAETAHRIEIIDGPAVTLFFVGPRRLEWGFLAGPNGWTRWQDFV